MGAAEIGGILIHACCPGDIRTSAPGSQARSSKQPVPLTPGAETAGDPLLKLRSKRGVGTQSCPAPEASV